MTDEKKKNKSSSFDKFLDMAVRLGAVVVLAVAAKTVSDISKSKGKNPQKANPIVQTTHESNSLKSAIKSQTETVVERISLNDKLYDISGAKPTLIDEDPSFRGEIPTDFRIAARKPAFFDLYKKAATGEEIAGVYKDSSEKPIAIVEPLKHSANSAKSGATYLKTYLDENGQPVRQQPITARGTVVGYEVNINGDEMELTPYHGNSQHGVYGLYKDGKIVGLKELSKGVQDGYMVGFDSKENISWGLPYNNGKIGGVAYRMTGNKAEMSFTELDKMPTQDSWMNADPTALYDFTKKVEKDKILLDKTKAEKEAALEDVKAMLKNGYFTAKTPQNVNSNNDDEYMVWDTNVRFVGDYMIQEGSLRNPTPQEKALQKGQGQVKSDKKTSNTELLRLSKNKGKTM